MSRAAQIALSLAPLILLGAVASFVWQREPEKPKEALVVNADTVAFQTLHDQLTGKELNETTDKMDGTKTFSLIVPGDSGSKAALTLRCSTSRNLAVIVASDEVVDQPSVRVKFDDNQPVTQTWSESTSHTALFAPNSRGLMKQMETANKMMVEYAMFRGGKDVATFDLTPLHDGIPKLAKVCGLTR